MKNRIFTVLLLTAFAVQGFCQTEPSSIADLDREAEITAAAVLEFVRSADAIRSIQNEQAPDAPPLVRYWIETILARLSAAGTSAGGVTVFDNPSARSGYILRCSILELGSVARIYTRLIRRADSSVAAAWTTDLAKTPYLSYLLSGQENHWDNFEPDSREQPVVLEINGTEISRSLHTGDQDWFIVSPEEDGYVDITTSGRIDTVMELYTDSFELIAENDDGPDDYNARLGLMVERGKNYIVLVRGYSEDETGSYGVKAVFSVLPDKDMEPNDSMSEAFPISIDTPVKAFIFSENEQDWYSFVLPGGCFVTIDAVGEGSVDMFLELFDAAGRKLDEDDDSGHNVDAKISLFLEAGTYYIKAGAYGTGEYSLVCALREPNQAGAYEPDDRRAY
ncbi:MAG: PPC domain-containing protein [Treponema sp.]|jgi:hypothetical protein|nr:PPC domain-containing protein [Treponema sp.]